MNPESSKLKHKHAEQAEEQTIQQTSQKPLEFQTPEELLRHDATQVVPPDSIIERLKASIAQEPKPSRSLWKRLMGE